MLDHPAPPRDRQPALSNDALLGRRAPGAVDCLDKLLAEAFDDATAAAEDLGHALARAAGAIQRAAGPGHLEPSGEYAPELLDRVEAIRAAAIEMTAALAAHKQAGAAVKQVEGAISWAARLTEAQLAARE